ncbi:Eukaryotic translation initiation factor 4E [Diplonema papillatum]|nr:Eukaryotic translation initiation factor 4E [Diplonema papillatum]
MSKSASAAKFVPRSRPTGTVVAEDTSGPTPKGGKGGRNFGKDDRSDPPRSGHPDRDIEGRYGNGTFSASKNATATSGFEKSDGDERSKPHSSSYRGDRSQRNKDGDRDGPRNTQRDRESDGRHSNNSNVPPGQRPTVQAPRGARGYSQRTSNDDSEPVVIDEASTGRQGSWTGNRGKGSKSEDRDGARGEGGKSSKGSKGDKGDKGDKGERSNRNDRERKDRRPGDDGHYEKQGEDRDRDRDRDRPFWQSANRAVVPESNDRFGGLAKYMAPTRKRDNNSGGSSNGTGNNAGSSHQGGGGHGAGDRGHDGDDGRDRFFGARKKPEASRPPQVHTSQASSSRDTDVERVREDTRPSYTKEASAIEGLTFSVDQPHPLHSPFKFLYRDRSVQQQDEHEEEVAYTLLSEVDTVEDFWTVYTHLAPVNRINTADIYFFKEGCRPMWEDHPDGCRMAIAFKKCRESALRVAELWEGIVVAIASGQFPHVSEVLGCVYSHKEGITQRKTGERLVIWLQCSHTDFRVQDMWKAIRRLAATASLPPQLAYYENIMRNDEMPYRK